MTPPNQQTPTPQVDAFIQKLCDEKAGTRINTDDFIALADFARERELQLQQLQKQNQELRYELDQIGFFCAGNDSITLEVANGLSKRCLKILSSTSPTPNKKDYHETKTTNETAVDERAS